jgi:hypothetical protein
MIIVSKSRLALTLAKALLQLDSTPWMNSTCSYSDIDFVPAPSLGGLSLPTRLNTTMFLNRVRTSENLPWASLLSFGILLLEIATGRLIFDSPDTTAEETLRDVMFMDLIPVMSESYANTVFHCLSRVLDEDESGRTRDRVSEDILRDEIFQNVVRPLEDELSLHNTFYWNMDLLAFSEASENIPPGIQPIKEAYQKFGREQRVSSRIEELGETTGDSQLE